MRMLLLVGVAGCAAEVASAPTLRVDPPNLDLVADAAQPAPSAPLHVYAGSRDVTDHASFTLAGDPVGTIIAGVFASDGHTGGAATLHVTADGLATDVPITVRATSRRVVIGVPVDTPAWFDSATDVAFAGALEPADGAVLPPNLGRLDVDFGALDTDDVHEIAVVGPYVDVRVYAPATVGPRHVELTPDEWAMVAAASRGRSVELIARSTASGSHATARVSSSHLGVADRDLAGALVFSGATVVNGAATTSPIIWRYDIASAAESVWFTRSDGGCIGCHIAISPDGRHLAAAGALNNGLYGVLVDTATGVATINSDTWQAMAYDPSGLLVTTLPGALVIRDGETGAQIAQTAVDVSPSHPAISPDGHSLVYSALDPSYPTNTNFGGTLRIHDWNAINATLGPARVLVTGTEGVTTPAFSSDGRWVMYTRTASLDAFNPLVGLSAVRADGSAPPIVLSSNPLDGTAEFAGPVAVTRAGEGEPALMTWIVMQSWRPVGARPQTGQAQLWLAAFDTERGTIATAFHLPNQRDDASVLHVPMYVH